MSIDEVNVGDVIETLPNKQYMVTTNGWQGIILKKIDKDSVLVSNVNGSQPFCGRVLLRYFQLCNNNIYTE